MLVPSRHHFCFPEPMGQKSHWRSLLHPPRHSPFSWTNRADEVAQTDFSALARLWFIPAGGDDGAGEAFPRALAMPVTHTLGPLQPKPRSSAPENAVRCMCSCSALHLPSQRAAYAHAARCVFCLTVGRVIRQRIPSPYRGCSITPGCAQR